MLVLNVIFAIGIMEDQMKVRKRVEDGKSRKMTDVKPLKMVAKTVDGITLEYWTKETQITLQLTPDEVLALNDDIHKAAMEIYASRIKDA